MAKAAEIRRRVLANLGWLFGVGLAVLFWIFDSAVDALLFGAPSFEESLLAPEPVEWWMRGVIVVLVIGICAFYGKAGFVSTMRDPSVRKWQKEVLQRSESRFRGILKAEVLDLRDIVSGVEGVVSRLIPENITLTANLATRLGKVRVDRHQVEQVILNPAINAREAMPDGGKLTIEVLNAELTEDFALENGGTNVGPHVLLATRDTGTGMDEVTRSRIFQPFFTT